MRSKNKDKNPHAEPTKAELEILQVLWEHGPSNVRFVNDQLRLNREVNYTSTLKQMQVMVEKQLLTRDESQMKHIYQPAGDEEKIKEGILKKFVNSMYRGSAPNLVLQLLNDQQTSKEDLQSIRDILNALENKK